jgi:hypothetical protein
VIDHQQFMPMMCDLTFDLMIVMRQQVIQRNHAVSLAFHWS